MKKRRPWWSELRIGLAALLGTLSLTLAAPDAGAASGQPALKVAKVATAGKAAKSRKASKPSRAARKGTGTVLSTEVGLADIIDRDGAGLHGQASFYGHGFQGRRTATGERFGVRQFTGASNHFPIGSKVAVRRLDNDRCAVVVVNDRMHAKHRRRVIDVSRGVAEYLGMIRTGVVLVRVAPLKARGAESGSAGCHAAFEAEDDCLNCGQPPKLPDFGTLLLP
ncbi:septal ring lytic transglycosylase RlpA family protein [Dechloromonas sp.]|uniref:septal ring lytic transglycosylase RlpA family protein n=1 Tax=Dechloromonas sp. TaxID=1917218 RepID=UPI00263F90D9|nr:septal ring lytic transglycosylase RlpA family protein [Dechloromonas sp.]